MIRVPFFRPLAFYLSLVMFLAGVAPGAEAALAPSEALAMPQFDRSEDLSKIRQALEMKMVKQRLQDLGFTSAEIDSRLDRMSDGEVHQLAQKLDELQVGGDALGVIIGLLVIAILVVILLQLTGHRIIIK